MIIFVAFAVASVSSSVDRLDHSLDRLISAVENCNDEEGGSQSLTSRRD
jgi:hypothetical protein